MRYGLFTGLLVAAGILVAPGLHAQQGDAPAAVKRLQAPQVVSRLLDLRTELVLTESQVERLSALRATFGAERSRLGPGPRTLHPTGGPVTSGSTAYGKAAAILTAAQQALAFRFLDREPARAEAVAAPDPLVHHAAGVAVPPAGREQGPRPDPMLHGTPRGLTEQSQAGEAASVNPMTHQ